MVFYRVHMHTDHGSSAGFNWHTSKREAEAEANKWAEQNPEESEPFEIEKIEVTPTKAGIWKALRIYASHPDNG